MKTCLQDKLSVLQTGLLSIHCLTVLRRGWRLSWRLHWTVMRRMRRSWRLSLRLQWRSCRLQLRNLMPGLPGSRLQLRHLMPSSKMLWRSAPWRWTILSTTRWNARSVGRQSFHMRHKSEERWHGGATHATPQWKVFDPDSAGPQMVSKLYQKPRRRPSLQRSRRWRKPMARWATRGSGTWLFEACVRSALMSWWKRGVALTYQSLSTQRSWPASSSFSLKILLWKEG